MGTGGLGEAAAVLTRLTDWTIMEIDKPLERTELTLRWRGGALTEITLESPRRHAPVRTEENTITLVHRPAEHYPNATIAGVP